MQGFSLGGCPDFTSWLRLERERLHRSVIQALETLIRYECDQKAYRRALPYAARLLQLAPYREEAHRSLMLLLALDGQQSAALAQYEACRSILEQELNITPSQETITLYEQIRTDTITAHHISTTEVTAARPSIWSHLPSRHTSFIGREEELRWLREGLMGPTHRLITIVGPGGIGKTRLAMQLADQCQHVFHGGACIVSLAQVASSDGLIIAICEALKLPLASNVDPKSQLLQALSTSEQLLILDNCEHLLDAGMLLLELLYYAPGVKIVVTSRERLRLQAESLLVLSGLALPDDDSSEYADHASAVRLFLERARQVDPSFQSSPEMLADITRVCRLVEGSPLGIELAATWVECLSPGEIACSIRENIDFLATTLRDIPERHRSMRAVFDGSWKLLTPSEQQALMRLSVFRSSCDKDVIHSVTEVSLADLIGVEQKSLLRRDSSGCYELHELIRHFAAEHLAAHPHEHLWVTKRHCLHYMALAEAAEPGLLGPDHARWLRRLQCAHADLRAALQWCIDHEAIEWGLRLVGALRCFWHMRGYISEALYWLDSLLARRREVPDTIRAKALWCAGWFAYHRGEYDHACQYYEEGVDCYRRANDQAGAAVLLNNLAYMCFFQGDKKQARVFWEENLSFFQSMGDLRGVFRSLAGLAISATDDYDFVHAQMVFEQQLSVAQELGDQSSLASVFSNQSVMAILQDNYTWATELCEQSLSMYRSLDELHGIACSLGNLAWIAVRQEDVDRAILYCRESMQLFQSLGDRRALVSGVLGMARIAQLQGIPTRAALLCGVASKLVSVSRSRMYALERECFERIAKSLKGILGPERFQMIMAFGEKLPFEHAIWYACDPLDTNEEIALRILGAEVPLQSAVVSA